MRNASIGDDASDDTSTDDATDDTSTDDTTDASGRDSNHDVPFDVPFDAVDTARARHRIVFSARYAHRQECPICLSPMQGRPATVYPCGHCVHYRCDARLRESNCRSKDRCVLCRARLPRDAVVSIVSVTLEVDADALDDVLDVIRRLGL